MMIVSPAAFYLLPRLYVRVFAASLVAWGVLWVWGQTRFVAFLDHGDWTQVALLQNICASIPGVSGSAAYVLSAVAWMLMVVAMMLPFSAPAIEMFVTSKKVNGRIKAELSAYLAGYMVFAAMFGVALHGFGFVLGKLTSGSTLFLFNGWIIGAAVFALAGVFQFSGVKASLINRSCCTGCTSPSGSGLSNFANGFKQASICFGCCGALMCLMFIFWPGSFVWMLIISAMMLVERHSAFARVSVGAALIASSVSVVLLNALLL